MTPADRAVLEERWLRLTRVVLPGLATERGWPVRHDHCFQRILLDAACGGRWTDRVAGRPAYRAVDAERLAAAVALAEQAACGSADLHDLHHRSLIWRGKRPKRPVPTDMKKAPAESDRGFQFSASVRLSEPPR